MDQKQDWLGDMADPLYNTPLYKPTCFHGFSYLFFSLSLDGKDDGRHHADGISRYYEVYEDSEGRQA